MMQRYLLPGALVLALFGYWQPWLALPAGALQPNAYELSEWVEFLPGVFTGALPFDRLTFLVPCACLTVLFGLAAARVRRAAPRDWLSALLPDSALGWVLLALAGLSVAAVFPYYPYLLSAYADPEFQAQFFLACIALLAVPLALLLPDEVAGFVQIALAVTGLGFSIWAWWALWPVASELMRVTWPPGWGWFATLLGFGLAAVEGWQRLLTPRLPCTFRREARNEGSPMAK
ncbi:MAG: hypothetical protein NZM11_02200 [Anaerolineales bacterium]|nr:hypothetical protein [Anaerolineales bacterium]